MALEVIWFRMLSLFVVNTTLAMSLMLAVVGLLRRKPSAATWCFFLGMAALGIDSEPIPAEATVHAKRTSPDIFGFGLLMTVLAIAGMINGFRGSRFVLILFAGSVLLAVGMALQSHAVRFASAAVVILTVFKVFLVDMRGLTGIWQSLSFLGLGAVLLGIGWLYQRLLFPRRGPPAAPPT